MNETTPPELPRAIARVKAALDEKSITADITEMPASTRTAEEAAAACGCAIGQIVKSLVFRGKQSGRPARRGVCAPGDRLCHRRHPATRP